MNKTLAKAIKKVLLGVAVMNKPLAQALQIVFLGVALLVASGIWCVLATSQDQGYAMGLGVAVCLAGAVGGVANNFRRLQRLGLHEWEKLEPLTLWLMTLQIYVSPIIGALFAVVLYTAFMSEILQGSVFPKFTSAAYDGLSNFIVHAVPTDSAGAAKAIFRTFRTSSVPYFRISSGPAATRGSRCWACRGA